MSRQDSQEEAGMPDVNKAIWEELYDAGLVLAYPSEVFVRLYHRHAQFLPPGRLRFLDHGAGSGNNSEFLLRKGHDVIATDISPAALRAIQGRTRFANLPGLETLLLDSQTALAPQLPDYDAVLAWDSLCYNTEEKARADLAALIDGLPAGGVMFVNMPMRRHDFFRNAEQTGPATFVFAGENGAQAGAVMTSPETLEDFINWCEGLDVLVSGTYGYTDDKIYTEFMFLVGRRR